MEALVVGRWPCRATHVGGRERSHPDTTLYTLHPTSDPTPCTLHLTLCTLYGLAGFVYVLKLLDDGGVGGRAMPLSYPNPYKVYSIQYILYSIQYIVYRLKTLHPTPYVDSHPRASGRWGRWSSGGAPRARSTTRLSTSPPDATSRFWILVWGRCHPRPSRFLPLKRFRV